MLGVGEGGGGAREGGGDAAGGASVHTLAAMLLATADRPEASESAHQLAPCRGGWLTSDSYLHVSHAHAHAHHAEHMHRFAHMPMHMAHKRLVRERAEGHRPVAVGARAGGRVVDIDKVEEAGAVSSLEELLAVAAARACSRARAWAWACCTCVHVPVPVPVYGHGHV